jgi:hypothetical protein
MSRECTLTAKDFVVAVLLSGFISVDFGETISTTAWLRLSVRQLRLTRRNLRREFKQGHTNFGRLLRRLGSRLNVIPVGFAQGDIV